jgi:hypothetical protein
MTAVKPSAPFSKRACCPSLRAVVLSRVVLRLFGKLQTVSHPLFRLILTVKRRMRKGAITGTKPGFERS